MAIETLSQLFLVAAGYAKPDCLLYKVDGRYVPMATAELVDRVRRLAGALQGAGIARGERVALMADNGPHWPTVDFATLCTGAVLVPIYPTLLPRQAAYIARDSGARLVFVQGRERLDGLLAVADQMPGVERFVLIDGEPPPEDRVTTLAALLAAGAGADPESFEQTARESRPEDLATLIYTSGTTGDPKGVMLSHHNIVTNLLAALEVLRFDGDYTALSFLPLSHSFERVTDYVYFYKGFTIAYSASVHEVAKDFLTVRPHVFVSVPRVYEKMLARVYETVASSPAWRQRLFHWAVAVGRRALPYRLRDRRPPGLLGLKLALADRLAFSKIRARIGGRFRYAVSGGAPLAPDVAEFFWGAGIPIYEGYGLTETSPVISANAPGAVKLGTVGRPVPGVEVRIAEDGEILARGPNIMQGYYNQPAATAETIDRDGWFHTGDIGELDEDGFLRITDRKKELIVNAYGKNIAPAPIENTLKTSRFIEQAVVLGDRRKFLSALLVPDFEVLAVWARDQGLDPADRAALVQDPRVRRLFQEEVDRVNATLAHYEAIQAWELVPQEFTLDTGELTPTLKVKRRVIHQKYGHVIDSLYADAKAS